MVICDAIILGAGFGTRFKSTSPKQFQSLDGVPVFLHSILTLLKTKRFRHFVLVVSADQVRSTETLVENYLSKSDQEKIKIVVGGARRQDSSRLGLDAIASSGTPPERVIIHDACRPFLSGEFVERLLGVIDNRSYAAWIPAVPVVDTLKRVENQTVVETVDRSLVHRVQTPQVFEYSALLGLVEQSKDERDLNFTDDAALCEYYGLPVGVFDGDIRNIKLTYDFEMETLRLILLDAKKEAPCESVSGTTFTA